MGLPRAARRVRDRQEAQSARASIKNFATSYLLFSSLPMLRAFFMPLALLSLFSFLFTSATPFPCPFALLCLNYLFLCYRIPRLALSSNSSLLFVILFLARINPRLLLSTALALLPLLSSFVLSAFFSPPLSSFLSPLLLPLPSPPLSPSLLPSRLPLPPLRPHTHTHTPPSTEPRGRAQDGH